MQTEEDFAAIGPIIKEAAESKKRIAVLRSEVDRASKALAEAADLIREVLEEGVVMRISNGQRELPLNERLSRAVSGIASADAILSLCSDLRSERARAEKLRQSIQDIGV